MSPCFTLDIEHIVKFNTHFLLLSEPYFLEGESGHAAATHMFYLRLDYRIVK